MDTKRKNGNECFIKDVRSEKEWDELCEYKVLMYVILMDLQGGITIVAVYFDWAGNCKALTSYLTKIRMEINCFLVKLIN